MQHFYSFVSHVVCSLLFSRFGACTAGIRPFPLSSISIHICLPGDFCTSPNRLLLRVLNAFQKCPPCCRTACPPSVWLVSLGLRSCWSLCPPFVSGLVSLLVGHCVRLVSLLFPFISLLVSLLVDHCVRLVSLVFPFVSLLVSLVVPLLVGHCVRLVFLLSFTCPPSRLQPFTFVSQLWTAVSASALQAFTCASLCLHLSPSSGLLCPPLPCNPSHLSPSSGLRCSPLPCNPSHLSPSSGLRCPPLPCNPLHLSPSAGLLCPPLPCNPLFVTQLWAACRLQSCLYICFPLCLHLSPSSGLLWPPLPCNPCLPALDVASSSCRVFRF